MKILFYASLNLSNVHLIRATKCSIRIKETGEVVVEGNWHGKIISK